MKALMIITYSDLKETLKSKLVLIGLMVLLALCGHKLYSSSVHLLAARSVGDEGLIAMLQRELMMGLSMDWLFFGFIIAWGAAHKMHQDFHDRTITMLLTRVKHWEYLFGRWSAFMIEILFILCVASLAALISSWWFQVALPSSFFYGFINIMVKIILVGTSCFTVVVLINSQVNVMFFPQLLIFLTMLAYGFEQLSAFWRPIFYLVYWLVPAGGNLSIFFNSLSTTNVNFDPSLMKLIIAENLLYIVGLLLVTLTMFERRDLQGN